MYGHHHCHHGQSIYMPVVPALRLMKANLPDFYRMCNPDPLVQSSSSRGHWPLEKKRKIKPTFSSLSYHPHVFFSFHFLILFLLCHWQCTKPTVMTSGGGGWACQWSWHSVMQLLKAVWTFTGAGLCSFLLLVISWSSWEKRRGRWLWSRKPLGLSHPMNTTR